jgi:glutamyl-Q tRNA(Asp) synthetase
VTDLRYRGRFAPSPTGPLHFGSLVTAVGSYLQARHCGGEWWLRIEDVDQLRCVAEATDAILHALTALGFHWDGELRYQSRSTDRYQRALTQLLQQHDVFPCACTRRRLAGKPYDGRCRQGLPAGSPARTIRVKVPNQEFAFTDQLQGRFVQNLAHSVGDFIIRRADGLFAYQLAVVVDDAEQGITEIVRGTDLLDNTPRQLHLQRLLGYPQPKYVHLPIILNAAGDKLSKQHHAPALAVRQPVAVLWQAVQVLGQAPPPALAHASLTRFWEWAISHWQLARVPPVATLPMPVALI